MEEHISLNGISVALVMPVYRDIHPQTVKSLMTTQQLMNSLGVRFNFFHSQGAYIEKQRNFLAKKFLEESDYNRIFWIDSDMIWEAQDFLRILALSTELEVVGAAYCYREDPVDFVLLHPKPWLETDFRYNRFGCVTYDSIALGLGFTCVHRKIMEELVALLDIQKEEYKKIFYSDSPQSGKSVGEDVNFFLDIQTMGYDVWLDPEVELGHIGTKVYKAKVKDHIDFRMKANGKTNEQEIAQGPID